ncbi:MAG: NAD(P)-dependent glycerol-3-phosphate dehydrogenase [candidate division Zixibacteria bacterium]|nr:NAD(P)-dependent glycerol-3-phosphate dehydrogenase [candidate division Zixibacteria bacterium]
MKDKVTILGAGSWAIANANLLASNGSEVTMWEFDADELDLLRKHREHPKKLPGVKIDESVYLRGDLSDAVEGAEVVLFAVPTQKTSHVCRQLTANTICHPDLVVNLSKGIEEKTLRRVSQIIAEDWVGIHPDHIITLSGPSHAEEVGKLLPTTVVVAGAENKCRKAQEIYSNPRFRAYRTTDIIGVELGGSLKNVIAIGAGIARGLGFGDNTQGALITRGLAEINRLAVKLGGDSATLAGLSGVGDLIATCTSQHSRNQYVGYHIGKGMTLTEVLDTMVMVAEGVTTCRSARELAKKHRVEMPITEAVCQVLFEDLPAKEAVTNLMTRPLKAEMNL